MRIRPTHYVPVALGLAVLVTGCAGGGGQKADTGDLQGADKDVAEAVYDFRDAVAKRDEAKICDTYFTPDLEAKVAADGKAAGRGDTCAKAIEDAVADIDATEITVKDVNVTGNTAVVTVATDLSKGEDASDTLTMQNTRGWRISELPSSGS